MTSRDIQESVGQCAQWIGQSQSIAVLTGAGISTNAGIPDFRGPRGLYVTKQYDADTVFDIGAFHRDPKPFYDFARDFIRLEKDIKPTPSHYFLKELERTGKLKGLITQNIDALHHKAGSQKVYEMHGSFWKSFCLACRKEFSYETMKERIFLEEVPYCACGGVIKPDVVFFGENVKFLNESFDLAQESDLFLVIGTSCVVYPAAMVPQYASGRVVIVNMGEVALRLPNISLSVQCDLDEFFGRLGRILNFNMTVR